MKYAARRRLAPTVLVPLFTVGFTVLSFVTVAGAGAPGLGVHSEQIPDGTPLADCVNAAVEGDWEQWVCVGGNLRTASVAKKGVAQAVQPSVRDRTEESAEFASTTAGADDYDGWCENGSICRRVISDYISETKGNAAYGDEDGVIGTFDQVLRVELNGRSPRMRGTWLWDSGPAGACQILCVRA